MKIAIAQLNPTIGDLTGNAERILTAANQAVTEGARLLLTPELSLCGYPPRDLLIHADFIAGMATTLAQLAQNLPPELMVLVGTIVPNLAATIAGGKPLFNSSALLLNGQIQHYFHKRLLPTYDVFDEDRYFESGQQVNRFEVDGVTIGVTICEDLWNDEEFWGKRNYAINPISELAQIGVDLTVNLSASPFSVSKQKLREAMLKHGAIRYQQPVIYANQVGSNDDLIFDGNSVAFNRSGELIHRARSFASDLILVEFDPTTRDLVAAPNQSISSLPETDDAEIWSALVLGVRDYARKCGFSKAVIGLSGGVDSALVATIAAAALGPDQVLGVLMPSPYSSDHSVNDARELAANLKIKTQILPIGNLMKSYDETLANLFAGTEFGITEENIQSRIRGNLLMAVANKFGYLLLSTGNKSEMAVGYCTLYGDMNGGLAAIADVPKTRVYSICRWLNAIANEADSVRKSSYHLDFLPGTTLIPDSILIKAPSAELKPGQVDQDSLPPYEILDDILERLIQNNQTAQQIIAAGHDPTIVNQVIKLVTDRNLSGDRLPRY